MVIQKLALTVAFFGSFWPFRAIRVGFQTLNPQVFEFSVMVADAQGVGIGALGAFEGCVSLSPDP